MFTFRRNPPDLPLSWSLFVTTNIALTTMRSDPNTPDQFLHSLLSTTLLSSILIPMGDVCVIVDMDCLSFFGTKIDYEGQRVVVRTPSRGELIVYGQGTKLGSRFCLAVRARRYIQHGCAGYLAYVVDTRVRDQISVS